MHLLLYKRKFKVCRVAAGTEVVGGGVGEVFPGERSKGNFHVLAGNKEFALDGQIELCCSVVRLINSRLQLLLCISFAVGFAGHLEQPVCGANSDLYFLVGLGLGVGVLTAGIGSGQVLAPIPRKNLVRVDGADRILFLVLFLLL